MAYRRLCLEVSSEACRHVRSSLSLFSQPLVGVMGCEGGLFPRPSFDYPLPGGSRRLFPIDVTSSPILLFILNKLLYHVTIRLFLDRALQFHPLPVLVSYRRLSSVCHCHLPTVYFGPGLLPPCGPLRGPQEVAVPGSGRLWSQVWLVVPPSQPPLSGLRFPDSGL